jgi:hypothetical protein
MDGIIRSSAFSCSDRAYSSNRLLRHIPQGSPVSPAYIEGHLDEPLSRARDDFIMDMNLCTVTISTCSRSMLTRYFPFQWEACRSFLLALAR